LEKTHFMQEVSMAKATTQCLFYCEHLHGRGPVSLMLAAAPFVVRPYRALHDVGNRDSARRQKRCRGGFMAGASRPSQSALERVHGLIEHHAGARIGLPAA
jgi:hypothetical protein